MAQDHVIHFAPASAGPAAAGSPFDWESRSADELKAIVARGLQGGELFEAARLELERRAGQARREEQAVEQVQVTHDQWQRRAAIVAIAGLVFAVPLVLLMLLF